MQWICNIAMFLVFSGILMELIADTKYYKFARWVAGVILLLQFLKPLTELEGIQGKFDTIFRSFDYALGTDRVLEEIYAVEGQTEHSVLAEYKEGISRQIDGILQKNGLKLVQTELSVEKDGRIQKMWVEAEYLDGTEDRSLRIPTVVPVRIGEETKKPVISPLELYIRETLAEFYQTDENNVIVVIEEAD